VRAHPSDIAAVWVDLDESRKELDAGWEEAPKRGGTENATPFPDIMRRRQMREPRGAGPARG
jgi:hypothetical protein